MIKNGKQYLIAKAQVSRFVRTLEGLREEAGVHPLILKAQKEAVCSQLSDLKADLREYESLKTGSMRMRERRDRSGQKPLEE